MRVLFWVQHLLGIGHVRRAAAITRALAESGAAVTVAQGGFAVPGTDFGAARVVALPPVRAADASFRTLLGEDGAPVTPAWREARREALLALHREVRPEIVLVESYPFGRGAFRFELEPLIAAARAARPAPAIACSVRDILVAKDDPARHARTAAQVEADFDRVLVHGDPALVPFGASFPLAGRIAGRITCTGYVTAPRAAAAPAPAGAGEGEVVVSVGGGAVGERLLRTALAAHALVAGGPATLARWRLLCGPDLPAAVAEELRAAAPPGVIVEPARRDFPDLLARCRVSVSQGGYNTVMDILAAGCRAVLVPFATAAETEQRERARLLAARGIVHLLPEDALTAAALAAAVAEAAAGPKPPRLTIAMDGAAATARALWALYGTRIAAAAAEPSAGGRLRGNRRLGLSLGDPPAL